MLSRCFCLPSSARTLHYTSSYIAMECVARQFILFAVLCTIHVHPIYMLPTCRLYLWCGCSLSLSLCLLDWKFYVLGIGRYIFKSIYMISLYVRGWKFKFIIHGSFASVADLSGWFWIIEFTGHIIYTLLYACTPTSKQHTQYSHLYFYRSIEIIHLTI